MWVEKKKYYEDKYREKSEEELKEEVKKKLEFSKEKKKLLVKIDKDKKLTYLKSLIERWLININTAKSIIKWEDLDNHQIKEIFDKIDEIFEVKNIDEILPKQYRITKNEYIKALENEKTRKEVLKKLDSSLDFLFQSSHTSFFWLMAFFSDLINSINNSKKEIITVQWNIIDIKRSLS